LEIGQAPFLDTPVHARMKMIANGRRREREKKG